MIDKKQNVGKPQGQIKCGPTSNKRRQDVRNAGAKIKTFKFNKMQKRNDSTDPSADD